VSVVIEQLGSLFDYYIHGEESLNLCAKTATSFIKTFQDQAEKKEVIKLIRQCCICWIVFGEKEPLEDKSVTHGLCGDCFKVEMEKLDKLKKEEV